MPTVFSQLNPANKGKLIVFLVVSQSLMLVFLLAYFGLLSHLLPQLTQEIAGWALSVGEICTIAAIAWFTKQAGR